MNQHDNKQTLQPLEIRARLNEELAFPDASSDFDETTQNRAQWEFMRYAVKIEPTKDGAILTIGDWTREIACHMHETDLTQLHTWLTQRLKNPVQ